MGEVYVKNHTKFDKHEYLFQNSIFNLKINIEYSVYKWPQTVKSARGLVWAWSRFLQLER